MIEYSDSMLLKQAYSSIEDGISSIEQILPSVESDEMDYDLNRQLQDYRKLSSLCQEELHKKGEAPERVTNELESNIRQSDISFNNKLRVGYKEESDTDRLIAAKVVDDIRQRLNNVREFADSSSSEAVNTIAMEIIEEEENHMEWMKSYVR